MTMSMPGAHRPTVAAPAVMKRSGLVRMVADSSHLLMIRPSKDAEPVGVYCQARDKRDAGKAKTVHICMHPSCSGKNWATFTLMAQAHPERVTMTARAEVHVYGLWSEDPVDPKDPTKGVIGLIAPAEPHAEE